MTEQHVTRILVVDDDRSIRETLQAVLQDEGYNVSEAEDGEVALKILQASKEPMVVLLDLRMPVLDGDGVLSFVAADQRLASRNAFLLITANRDFISEKTKQLLVQLQVPVISKPFELDRLIDAVAETAYRQTTRIPPESWTDTSPHQATRGTNN
ncbi:MAG: response regulator [Ktedonobacterales bacterium]